MINGVKKVKKKYLVLILVFVLLFLTPFTYSRYTSKYTKKIIISAINTGYMVKFDANGGKGEMGIQSFVSGTSQKLFENKFTKDDYVFSHWNTKQDGTGISYEDQEKVIDLTDVNGSTVTLYAIYAREKYIYNGDITFDGKDGKNPYIDTNIFLFSEENINRDFEVSFEIKNRVSKSDNGTGEYPTMMSAMDERGAPWPGMVYRVFSESNDQLVFNASSTEFFNYEHYLSSEMKKVIIKRINGAIYVSLNDGAFEELLDASSMTPFDYPVVFGASYNNEKKPQRWFEGTLSNLKVVVNDSDARIGVIKYNPNGGVGNPLSQHVLPDTTFNLTKNPYINEGYVFNGWNTASDGSGTSYTDEQEVSNIVAGGARLELFAQWKRYKYYVEFYPKKGTTDGMFTQEFTSGESKNLIQLPSEYAIDDNGYTFAFWNTSPNGSGDSYEDMEAVLNIATKENQVIKFYPMYEQFSYRKDGDITFDENANFDGKKYIDTHIYLFSRKNMNKDFEISFEIKNYNNIEKYDTIISALDEKGKPFSGFVFRINDKNDDGNFSYNLEANAITSKEYDDYYPLQENINVVIRRVDGILYLKLGDDAEMQIIDYKTFTNGMYYPVTVGASLDENFEEWRNFKGTISNLNITISQ